MPNQPDFTQAPFSEIDVQRLNEYQTSTGPGVPFHPFTCGNRDDGEHSAVGGDTGILIATQEGWVCPHCGYTQDWAHVFMTQRFEAPSELSFLSKMRSTAARKALEVALLEYQALAAHGARGADVMVACLLRRQAEMEKDSHVSR